MEKINVKNVAEVLSEKELKNVLGGGESNGCAQATGNTCPAKGCATANLRSGTCGWYQIEKAMYCCCIENDKKKGTPVPAIPNDSIPKPLPEMLSYVEDTFPNVFTGF